MQHYIYNKQTIAERIKALVAEEHEYMPFSDAALYRIVSDEGLQCTPGVVYHIRKCLGFGSVQARGKAYAEKRKQLKDRNAK